MNPKLLLLIMGWLLFAWLADPPDPTPIQVGAVVFVCLASWTFIRDLPVHRIDWTRFLTATVALGLVSYLGTYHANSIWARTEGVILSLILMTSAAFLLTGRQVVTIGDESE